MFEKDNKGEVLKKNYNYDVLLSEDCTNCDNLASKQPKNKQTTSNLKYLPPVANIGIPTLLATITVPDTVVPPFNLLLTT